MKRKRKQGEGFRKTMEENKDKVEGIYVTNGRNKKKRRR